MPEDDFLNAGDLAEAATQLASSASSITIADFSQNSITISAANRAVLVIKPDGRLERGEGFASEDVASMQIFDILSRAMPSWMSALRERAEKAEAALGVTTSETLDEVDRRIGEAIDRVCRHAGGINDDPSPLWVREIFKASSLAIVPLKASGD